MRAQRLIVLAVCLALASAPAAFARPDKDYKDYFVNFAGGYSGTTGDLGDVAEDGFNLRGGFAWWPKEWPVGLQFELGFNAFDLEQEVIDSVNADDGDVETFEVLAGGIISTDNSGPVDFFATAGIGGYYLQAEVTEPGLVRGTICDPWLWWCYTGTVRTDVVTEEIDTWKFGWNASVGANFKVGDSGNEVYVQIQYHSVQTETTSEYIPVVVGFRF